LDTGAYLRRVARGKPSSPLAAASLTEVFLWARDFPRLRDFYHEVMGLPIGYENPHFCRLKAGKGAIDLHAEREPHRVGDNWFLHFEVADLDAVVRGLKARGVSVGAIRAEDFGRVCSLQDPEGNEIGLEESPRKRR